MTVELASQLWDYNSDTGLLTWKVSPRNGVRVGDVAGNLNSKGYLQVKYKGKSHHAHRIAWLIAIGYLPKAELDHVNGIRDDNRLENLREATRRQNCRNKNCHRVGQLRFTYYNKRDKKWRAQAPRIDGKKQKFLGDYNTMEEASKVVECWLAENHPELK
jgi:hypothetical protein